MKEITPKERSAARERHTKRYRKERYQRDRARLKAKKELRKHRADNWNNPEYMWARLLQGRIFQNRVFKGQ